MSDVWIEYKGSEGYCYECGGGVNTDSDIIINIRFRDDGSKIALCHDCFLELQDYVEANIIDFENLNERGKDKKYWGDKNEDKNKEETPSP